jgi:hypothetical protein
MAPRALVAYSTSSTHVQTTRDYILGFSKYSGFETDFVHVTHDAKIGFDFKQYDVIFHNYCSRFCFEGYVSEDYRKKLKAFGGVKILAVQDEYDRTDTLKAAIRDNGFHIVLTCVPQDSLEYVYPKAQFPSVRFITVFTGYVPDDFEQGRPPPPALEDRPITVGYRGRDIGGRYGRLGFDKYEIGRRMKEVCDARGVNNDIAMDEASRIYGTAWFDYLGRCRSMLGSESGSNVFDFDGKIEKCYNAMKAEAGGAPPSYESFRQFVAERDAEIDMGQISPRIFECALMRTPMVLFRGRYSDALQPDAHYISLEKDFSNVDEVLRRLDDIPALKAMTDRAYAHLVGSGRFGYRAYFGMVADAARKAMKRTTPGSRRRTRATETGLVLRDWFGHEQPSRTPGGQEQFRMRLALAEIRLLKGEDVRLTAEFGTHAQTCAKVLNDQLATLRAVQRDICDRRNVSSPEGAAAHVSPAMARAVDAAVGEDSAWADTWSGLSAAVAAGTDSADLAELPTAIQAALEGVRSRYRTLGERFARFGDIYQVEFGKLTNQIDWAHKRLAWSASRQSFAKERNMGNWRHLVDQTSIVTAAWCRRTLRVGAGEDPVWLARVYRRAATIVRSRNGQ